MKRLGRLLNFRGPGEALNRYEALIRERRLFHFNSDVNYATKQIRRVVCSLVQSLEMSFIVRYRCLG